MAIVFALYVLTPRRQHRRKRTGKSRRQNTRLKKYRTALMQGKRINTPRGTMKSGASAQPFPFAPQGRGVFAAQKAGLPPAPPVAYAA
ncbi:hypothetical protein EGH51_23960 [Klebsiella aerogenes]|nr:hypothetical protein OA41_19140 [Klebsiella aerogenes]RSV97737.1 hypothetical protein EGH51_23960 [Klebsiella aerogenes]